MKIVHIVPVFCLFFLISCSSEENDRKPGDHVWKDQVEAIDRARETEKILEEAHKRQKKILEEQTQYQQ